MKPVLKMVLMGSLLFGLSSIAMAIEIQGTVVSTTGLDVTVKVFGKSLPVQGDTMEISFSIPGGEALSIGAWKVTSVSGHLVTASVIENTGTPSKGQRAVIISTNPVPAKEARRNNAPASQKTISAPTGNSYASPEALEIIALLQSSEAANIRNGAKKAHRHFAHDDAVLAVVAAVLNRGYAEKSRDRYHVDAMAWLCKVLGASKDIKYKELLTIVSKKSPSKKIRKYAIKNIRLLR